MAISSKKEVFILPYCGRCTKKNAKCTADREIMKKVEELALWDMVNCDDCKEAQETMSQYMAELSIAMDRMNELFDGS